MVIFFQRRMLSLLIGFALIGSLFIGCGEKSNQPVARVGGRIITVLDFEDSFSRGKSKKILAEAELQSKLDHLNKMIDKELQIVDAYRKALEKDEEIAKKVERRGESTIFRRLIDKEVIDPNISESEIRGFYEKSKKQVKVSEIVLKMNPNATEQEQQVIEKQLQEIEAQIKSGTDFSKLVDKYSQDKNKKVSPQQGQKGLLSWTPFTADDPVTQKAFSMNKGDISEPIKTPKGYSIIKVQEIIKPIVKAFSQEDDRIRQQILRKRGKEMEQKYFDFIEKLKKKYAVEFNDDNIQKFVDLVIESSKETSKTKQQAFQMDRNRMFQNINSEDEKLPLVKYSGGDITIKQFIDEINKFPITRRPNLTNKEEVFNLVDRRFLMQRLLKLESEAQNLREDKKVKEQFVKFSESYMLGKIKQMEVNEKINITKDDLKKYYEEHLDEFKNQEKREVQEISVEDEKLANKLFKRAKAGENFTKLVKKYTIKETSKKNDGNLGFITRSRQHYGKPAFNTEVGGIAGPFRVGKNYSIIKVLNIKAETYKSFEQSERFAKAKLSREMKTNLEKEWMEKLRKEIEITIYENTLKNTFSNYKTD